jgi:ribosomal protein S18 acetylase RimI-like enzyme
MDDRSSDWALDSSVADSVIRPYEPRDYSDVKYLNDISYESPCTETVLQEKLAGKVWVWEDSPLVIGCLILDGNFVWSVTVAPPWRGRGIGGKLLEEAEKHLRPLFLHTEPHGQAISLYRKLGYATLQTEEEFYGPGQDAVLMVKR